MKWCKFKRGFFVLAILFLFVMNFLNVGSYSILNSKFLLKDSSVFGKDKLNFLSQDFATGIMPNPSVSYNRTNASNYANHYCDKYCHDGYYYHPRLQDKKYLIGCSNFISIESKDQPGADCAHFVSCCIGNHSGECSNPKPVENYPGGGLKLDKYHSENNAYGRSTCLNLANDLFNKGYAVNVSTVEELESGDVIIYHYGNNNTFYYEKDTPRHAVFYNGNFKVHAHSNHTNPGNPLDWWDNEYIPLKANTVLFIKIGYQYTLGCWVRVPPLITKNVNVRDKAGGEKIGIAKGGAIGKVIDGPISATYDDNNNSYDDDNYYWYKIDFESGLELIDSKSSNNEGWVASKYLRSIENPHLFNNGDKIKAKYKVSCRKGPGKNYVCIGDIPKDSDIYGTIINTATYSDLSDLNTDNKYYYPYDDGYTWVKVRWNNGKEGWSVQNYLEKSEIEITSPKNEEIIKAGDQYTIKWNANAKNLKNNIYIWYHTGDEKWINIAHNLPVDQTSYLWTVPNTPSEDCYLLVGSGKPTNNNTISLDVYDQVKFTIKSGKSEDDKLPDLQGVSYTVNSWSIKEGEMLQISVTVTNKGDGNANPSKLALYLSPHDDLDINDDYFVKKEYVGKLLPNDSQKVTFSFSIPDLGSGTYNMWLIFDVDCDKEVKESDERNTFKGNKPLEIKDSQAGGSQLSVPKTISPSCGSTITVPPTGVTFTWSSVSGATYYEFELYKGSERRAYEKYNTTSCSWDLGDKEDEYLCWRVRACNNSGCGQWSELCCFTKKVKSGGGNPPDNKPQPPKNLTATAGDGYVELSWSPSSSSNLQGYRIYRGTSSGGESFYDAVPQTRTTYKNTNVNNGTTYYYYVTALDKNGNESEPSNRVSATPNKSGGGNPPSDEKVKLTLYVHEGSSNGPTISGASVSGYDAKNNYFSKTTNNSGYVEIEGVPGNWSFKITKSGYKDNNWNQSITSTCTKHAYIEKDSNSGGGSEKPQPPKNLKAEVVFDSSTRKAGIRISWDAPSSSSVTKYRMYRKEEGGSYSSIGDRDSAYTTFRDWGITLGKKYYYKVSSINNSGESDYSNEANIIAGVLVTTNANLNVRKGAGLSYDKIVTLPKGTYGLAISGPSKADGYYWWYCFWNYNNNNYYGWSIEDGLDFYSGPLSIKEPIDVITCFIFSYFRCPILCQEYLSNDNKLLHYEIGY